MKPRVLIAAALLGLAVPCLALAATTGEVPPVEGMPQLAFGHPEQGRFLVANVVWLLVTFIGEDITGGLLRETWPWDGTGEATQTPGEER